MLLTRNWIAALILLLLYLKDGYGKDVSIVLSGADCSSEHEVPIGGSLLVSASSSSVNSNCSLKFHTEDPSSTIVLSFSSNYYSYSYAYEVFVSFFALKDSSTSLMKRYTYTNWSSMSNNMEMQANTSALVVVIGGASNTDWRLYFTLEPKLGPISDYPFSLAAGVFSLSITCTVVFGLLIICFWCCCCKKKESVEQVSARRRQRMINQLAKEGYSVSRGYGSLSSTQPLIGHDGAVVDIFYQPPVESPQSTVRPPQPFQPQGYQGAYREPPPTYASVETYRTPAHHPSASRMPVQQTSNAPAQQIVPEGLLIDIAPPEASGSANVAEAPPEETLHQDLIEFGTPPEQPVSPLE
ncbi:uncharacterized protein [Watersipora subatra]|uniref:uncharacterized protein n=1 Tax=Watersipora subatra TaxID=2589382 RepID=UPI00355B693A